MGKDDEDFENRRTKTKQTMKKKETRFRASAGSEDHSLELEGSAEDGMLDEQEGFLPRGEEVERGISISSKQNASRTWRPLSSSKRGGHDLPGNQQVGSFADFAFKRICRP
jgi:hypothetical protein